MQYNPPSFRKPQEYGVSLDGIFDAYMKHRAEKERNTRQDFADTVEFGAPVRGLTPDQLQRAAHGPTPAQPAGFAMPGTMIGAPTPAQPEQFDADPTVAAIQAYVQRRKQGAAMGAKKEQLGIQGMEADIGLKNAQAAALGRQDIYFDPASGKQMAVPRGAKPLPAGTGSQGKMLPPASVLALNEGSAVARQLPDVAAALKEAEGIMGPAGGRIGSANPYDTQAQTIDARFRTASQAFGRFMEGGVLRKEDEDKYRKMFPQLSDTPDVARNKLSIVQRMLAQKYESDKGALSGSGYDVSGFGNLEIPESLFAGSGPAVGTVQDGYRFKGGNPADPSSWEPVR